MLIAKILVDLIVPAMFFSYSKWNLFIYNKM